MASVGGCERDVVHKKNKGYKAREELKSVLINRGFGIIARKYLYIYEGVIIVPTTLNGPKGIRCEKC